MPVHALPLRRRCHLHVVPTGVARAAGETSGCILHLFGLMGWLLSSGWVAGPADGGAFWRAGGVDRVVEVFAFVVVADAGDNSVPPVGFDRLRVAVEGGGELARGDHAVGE